MPAAGERTAQFRSEYAYLGVGAMKICDLLDKTDREIAKFDAQIEADGLTALTMAEILLAHPLVAARSRLLELQYKMTYALFSMSKHASKPEDEDSFDTWLGELERTNRPYRSRNRGEV